MKHQKHYKSVQQIEKDISDAIKKAEKFTAEANERLVMIEEARKLHPHTNTSWLKDEADELFAKAERIRETRLKRLQYTLAAFQTLPLPTMADVDTVVLQDK